MATAALAQSEEPIIDEQRIHFLKQEIRQLRFEYRHSDRRSRYEIGQRLSTIQAERARAKIGFFTTVDLPELRISANKAYAYIKFFKRLEAKRQGYLLQIAKDQSWLVEDVAEYEKRLADAQVEALNKIMDEEDARISKLRNTRRSYPTDYQIRLKFLSSEQRINFKATWLALTPQARWRLTYRLYRTLAPNGDQR